MTYPIFNGTRPYEAVQYANNVTGQWYGIVLLAIIFAVAFMTLSKYKSEKAFAVASYLVAILAILFRPLEIIGDSVVIMCILLAIIALIANYISQKA